MSLTITVRKNTETTGGTPHQLSGKNDNGNQAIDTRGEAEDALAYVTKDDLVAVVGGKTYTRKELISIRDGAAGAPKGGMPSGGNAKPSLIPGAPAGSPPNMPGSPPPFPFGPLPPGVPPFVPGAPAAAPAGDPPGAPAQPASGDAAPKDGAKPGEGVSHGFKLGGGYSFGLGDKGHKGGFFRVGYVAGVPVAGSADSSRLFVDLGLGLTFGNNKAAFQTPGGEDIVSGYSPLGGQGEASLRFVPNILDKRLAISLGVLFGVGGLLTADSATVKTPGNCTPGDFGRSDCEPTAGPRTGNAGTKGLMNFDAGSARGTSGLFTSFGVPVVLSGSVARGAWGSLNLYGGAEPGVIALFPKDGHGFSHPMVNVLGGVTGQFGGAAAYVPAEQAEAPVQPPAAPVAAAYEANVVDVSNRVKPEGRFSVAVEVSAKSEVTVQFKDAAGKLYNAGSANVDAGMSVSEFQAPSSLTAGKYSLVVTMKDPQSKVEKVEEREITIVERVEWTVPGSFAPGQPPAAQDVRVVGQPKLEGVSYVIVARDKEGKKVGELKVTDKPGTIEDKRGSRIAFKAPDINGKAVGWQKDITYRVALLNKSGDVLDAKSFEIGQNPPPPPPPKFGKAKKSGS